MEFGLSLEQRQFDEAVIALRSALALTVTVFT